MGGGEEAAFLPATRDSLPATLHLLPVEDFVPLGQMGLLVFVEIFRGVEDFDLFDFVALGDGIDDILSFGHFTEDGVFAVEVRRGNMSDEKLAPIGAGAAVGHGENTRLVVFEAGSDFVAKFVSRAARAGSGGIAALNHEVCNHAMEGNAVVIATLSEVDEVGHGHRGLGGEKGRFDVALVGFHENADIGHQTGSISFVGNVVNPKTGKSRGRGLGSGAERHEEEFRI